ncbi:MAG: cytochrome c oxidase subunit 3 [Phycisphaerales bacterium]
MTAASTNDAAHADANLKPHERYVHGHHWRSAADEFEGGKFGMWLFLSTELLLFSGFFCAYFVFRMLYPENWHTASAYYLNWKIGFANTIVLLLSSWTVVMSIRAAQLGRRNEILAWLGITQLCALFFLVVKLGWEYWPKIQKSELPGANFNYAPHALNTTPADPAAADIIASAGSAAITPASHSSITLIDHANIALANHADTAATIIPVAAGGGDHGHFTPGPHDQIFLSVYWVATATHGVHVLVGIIVFALAMWKAYKFHFGPKNYLFLENAGLYWHVVDIIWIFLFPLLYLV